MRISEVFDQPYPWKWGDRSSQRQWTANFADVVVFFAVNGDEEWDVTFSRKNNMNVTGEGDQFKIFATVIDIAKDFIKLKRPKVLKFSAEKEDLKTKSTSRPKLYSAMVRRFASSFGYEFREQSQYDDYTDYILIRKQDESVTEDGKIVPGVNTTVDVKPGETERQAAKFGNKITKNGPPLLMAEKRYTAKEWAILEGGHSLEESSPAVPRRWFTV
jgi:hypothetical protein